MAQELATIIDFIRYAASRFSAADVTLGHGHVSPVDEASHLVLSALHLPPDLPPAYAAGRLTDEERRYVTDLIEKRISECLPVAYLVKETWFAGMKFKSDQRALVPRSPLAELAQSGFSPWMDQVENGRVLDLCTGSGCIGLATAAYLPDWHVDLVDISTDALALAKENRALHRLESHVDIICSDLFQALASRQYDLIVSNPPYVSQAEFDALPAEYEHEPALGLVSGKDGLDICLRILSDAPHYLNDAGMLIVEVGESASTLMALLPQVPFMWIEFETGFMGVFALDRATLVAHADDFRAVQSVRS